VNNSRRHLEHAQQGLKKGLQVASKYARKQRLSVVLRCLRAIQTLQSAKGKLTELLTRGHLLGAIELWQECAMTVGYFRALASLGELAGTIQDTRMLIDVHVDQYMTNVVSNYSMDKFIQVCLCVCVCVCVCLCLAERRRARRSGMRHGTLTRTPPADG
jgi:hypothetical protein